MSIGVGTGVVAPAPDPDSAPAPLLGVCEGEFETNQRRSRN